MQVIGFVNRYIEIVIGCFPLNPENDLLTFAQPAVDISYFGMSYILFSNMRIELVTN
jgi:hypothetical protein